MRYTRSESWGRGRLLHVLVSVSSLLFFFFLNDPAPPEIYPLPLPAALPIPHPHGDGRGPCVPRRSSPLRASVSATRFHLCDGLSGRCARCALGISIGPELVNRLAETHGARARHLRPQCVERNAEILAHVCRRHAAAEIPEPRARLLRSGTRQLLDL